MTLTDEAKAYQDLLRAAWERPDLRLHYERGQWWVTLPGEPQASYGGATWEGAALRALGVVMRDIVDPGWLARV